VKKTLLIVDDDEAARESLGRLLSARGHTVRTAHDAEEATRLLAAEPVQIILLDLDLPHVPGDSLAAFLHIRHPKTRIIFMSGQYDMVNPERFGDNSIYFRKPLDLDSLIETVESSEDQAAQAH
jgi:DNA-binding NtrC family response regulator